MATPVTTPDEEIVAMPVEPDTQVPPDVPSVKLVVLAVHTVPVPLIGVGVAPTEIG